VTAEAAAALLGTSPTILSLWEERFGYPVHERSHDGQRLYADEMMLALRDALSRELSIPAAIHQARRR
jgi:DNA-binding transcriptional MerR regulator